MEKTGKRAKSIADSAVFPYSARGVIERPGRPTHQRLLCALLWPVVDNKDEPACSEI